MFNLKKHLHQFVRGVQESGCSYGMHLLLEFQNLVQIQLWKVVYFYEKYFHKFVRGVQESRCSQVLIKKYDFDRWWNLYLMSDLNKSGNFSHNQTSDFFQRFNSVYMTKTPKILIKEIIQFNSISKYSTIMFKFFL